MAIKYFYQEGCIEQTGWYKNPNQFIVMMRLLMKATHKDTFFTKGKKRIDVHRGQFYISVLRLMELTGLTHQTLRTTLQELKEKGELKWRSTNAGTLFTIIKMDIYRPLKARTNKRQQTPKEEEKHASKGTPEQEKSQPTNISIIHKKSLEDRSDFDSKQSVYKTRETAKIKGADPQQNPKHKNTEFEHKEFYLFGIFDYYPGKKDIEKVRKEFNNRIHTEGDFFDLCVTTEIYLEACSRRKSKPTSLRQFLIEWRDHQANPAKEISDWDIAQIKGESELYYQFIANLQVKKGKKTLGIPFVCKSGSAPEKIIFEFKDPETLKFLRGIRTRHSIDSHSSLSYKKRRETK